jgi:DNA-binding GntR family transcriptional regulator
MLLQIMAMSIVPDKSTSFSEPLVATLKERIITWQYPPEHRFTEDALCREFGVSRSPVREALRFLAVSGFVQRTPNHGYSVRQVKVKEVEELYDVRLALELFSVEALATRGAPPAKLSVIAEVWRAVQQNPKGDLGDLATLDARFHEDLARLYGNAALLQQLEAINERLYMFRSIDFARRDRVKATCEQHLAIIERIAARDAAGARVAMRRNIEDGRNIVGTSIKEALARAYAGV